MNRRQPCKSLNEELAMQRSRGSAWQALAGASGSQRHHGQGTQQWHPLPRHSCIVSVPDGSAGSPPGSLAVWATVPGSKLLSLILCLPSPRNSMNYIISFSNLFCLPLRILTGAYLSTLKLHHLEESLIKALFTKLHAGPKKPQGIVLCLTEGV